MAALKGEKRFNTFLTVLFALISIFWVIPVIVVIFNAFKVDKNLYRTIPIQVQYLKGSYGAVELGATMAIILMGIIPVIIFYLCCQKYIIKGVAAGAVKG